MTLPLQSKTVEGPRCSNRRKRNAIHAKPRLSVPTLLEDSYSFTIYALPVESLPIPEPVAGQSFPRVMDNLLKETALAAVEYRGTASPLATTSPMPPTAAPPCPAEGAQPDGCLSAE